MRTGTDGGRPGATGSESNDDTGAGTPVGDQRTHNWWADLTGVRPMGGRRRLRIAVVAAVVAVGAAGGYIGLTSAGVFSSSDSGHPGALQLASAASASRGRQLPVGAASGASGAFACPMIPGTVNMTGGDGSVGSATHVFTRTTAGGVTIRAYRLPSTTPCGCGPLSAAAATSSSSGSSSGSPTAGSQILPWDSVVSPVVSLELSDTTAVDQGDLFDAMGVSATTPNATTEPTGVIANAFGVVEGAPVWWVAVSVGPDVASAQMTFADGSTDQMSPVDGIAVLAHQINPSVASSGGGPYDVRGTLQLLDSSGGVIKVLSFPQPTPPLQPSGTPLPVSPPATVPGGTTSASIPVSISPPISNESMIACPELKLPAASPPGSPPRTEPQPASVGSRG